jgi:hypothetical protein
LNAGFDAPQAVGVAELDDEKQMEPRGTEVSLLSENQAVSSQGRSAPPCSLDFSLNLHGRSFKMVRDHVRQVHREEIPQGLLLSFESAGDPDNEYLANARDAKTKKEQERRERFAGPVKAF